MRKLIAVLALLICPLVWASPTWVRSNGSFSQPSSTVATQTDTLTTSTAGNTVLAFVSWKAVAQTVSYVCGGASCTGTTSTGKFFPYTWAVCSASTCTQLWICRNCPAVSSATVKWSGNTVSTTQFDEYSGVVSIGQIENVTGSSTSPSLGINIQDANDVFVVSFSSLGNNGVPISSTGNLRSANQSGATNTFNSGAACDNTNAVSGATVTCTVTLTTSGAWAAVGVELRGATTSDSANFVEAFMPNGAGGDSPSVSGMTGPLVADSFLAGNTAICWVKWKYVAAQTETVTTRNTMTGTTVDTFTKDKEIDDTQAGPYRSLGIFRVAATTGVQYVNIAMGTADTESPADFAYGCAELKGIQTSSPVRTTGGAANVNVNGTISSTALTVSVGDIVVVVATPDNNFGIGYQDQTSGYCAPGPGFVLLAASTSAGICAEYTVATTTSVTPSLYMPNVAAGWTGGWNIAAVAYIPNSSQGTAPTGMYIARTMTPVINSGTVYQNCPSKGNFYSFAVSNQLAARPQTNNFKFWDSNQVAYSMNDPSPNTNAGAVPFLLYSTNSTLDNSGMCETWQSSANGSNSELMQRDIVGAATSNVFDTLGTTCPTTGTTSVYNPTGCAGPDTALSAGIYDHSPNIQPTASGELVLGIAENGVGPEAGISSPSGVIFDCPYFSTMTDSDTTCYGEGHAHYYTTGTTALDFNWTAGANATGDVVGTAIAIKPAPAAASVRRRAEVIQ